MAHSLFDLTGKTAVVIGGTSGIGLAMAVGLAEAGADVVATSRRQEQVDEAAALIESRGRKSLRLTSDVGDRASIQTLCDETVKDASFPYGCHVCEVEIDPDTGTLEIVRHVAVDDVGRAVNPMIIHGQTHGGIAQGVGQALLEHCFYDAESGQPLAGSFMDYAMPRAAMLPFFTTEISEVPSTTHPLGMRPAGEGGTTPALAVVVNAIVDALAEFGVTHIEMPVTPERIWRAIRGMPDRSRSEA